ncbi:MAG TPA: phosphatase PAP2 family protein [Chthoniobacterales bacterium]|nr:phosphatase PAP2 family protein [Chthoniobacterales bacterium]
MKGRSIFYWVIGILIAAVAIVASFYFDDAARDFVAQHQNRTARNFLDNVSRFGDWPEHFALGLILAGIAWWRGSKRWTRTFLSMLAALAIAGLIGRGIKISTGRARPSVKSEEVWNGPRFSSRFHAFPSGHVAASTAFFAVLFLANWRIGLACVPVPILIGISRMYVAAHYLSDVVCAAILGILCAILVDRFFLQKIRNPQSAIRN